VYIVSIHELSIEKSKVLNRVYTIAQHSNSAISPSLFVITANKDALLACIRVAQKFINKYEQIPTPSQPINNCSKLSESTKKIIKNVNKDKYEKKRFVCGSERIYSTEYTCAHTETIFITTSMLDDKESNTKPHCIDIKSIRNQSKHFI